MSIFLNYSGNSSSTAAEGLHIKHRKWEPERVYGQLEGCNRNLRPKAAVAKVFHRKGIVIVLNIPGKNIEWIYIFDIANI